MLSPTVSSLLRSAAEIMLIRTLLHAMSGVWSLASSGNLE